MTRNWFSLGAFSAFKGSSSGLKRNRLVRLFNWKSSQIFNGENYVEPGVVEAMKHDFGSSAVHESGFLRFETAHELVRASIDRDLVDVVGFCSSRADAKVFTCRSESVHAKTELTVRELWVLHWFSNVLDQTAKLVVRHTSWNKNFISIKSNFACKWFIVKLIDLIIFGKLHCLIFLVCFVTSLMRWKSKVWLVPLWCWDSFASKIYD